ncbi:protein kinase domain-containing protein [Acrocarpospora catenulata]|uniref:protein kinase domain-containing protein n=1 Tax=Acrocarpospora catenulata TaxID=2836182 RepID=UPI001BDAC439|nr:serine/threonine-protein kinase [Acrocarpospora catenulata]
MPDARVRPARAVAGRYRIIRELGRGGTGTVWQAYDQVLGREVALKRVDGPVQGGREQREQAARRIRREVRATARLRHPSVIRVYDVVDDTDGPWIVMEFLNAESLADRLARSGPLPEREAARIVLRVLDALRAAHQAGVVHRDVKPGNILLGPGDEVVLTDFGIAPPTGDPTITSRGRIAGSVAYLAPERIRGEAGDAASDLWSVGATLFAAVEGVPPYERRESATALSHEPPPLRRTWLLRPALLGLLRRDRTLRISIDEAVQLLTIATADLDKENVAAHLERGEGAAANLGRGNAAAYFEAANLERGSAAAVVEASPEGLESLVGSRAGEFGWFTREQPAVAAFRDFSAYAGRKVGVAAPAPASVRKGGARGRTWWAGVAADIRDWSARGAGWLIARYGAADDRPMVTGRHVRKSRPFAFLGLEDPDAQVGFVAALSGLLACVSIMLWLPPPVPWLFVLSAAALAAVLLAAPILPETLAPDLGWRRWVLVAGAAVPFVATVPLALDFPGLRWPALHLAAAATVLWLGFLSALTWRISPVAAVPSLLCAATYTVALIVGVAELWTRTPVLRLPAALLLAQVHALAAAWWAGWAAYVSWRRRSCRTPLIDVGHGRERGGVPGFGG